MKKIKSSTILFLFMAFLMPSSIIKSSLMPGWGELNEYKALAANNDIDKIRYIKERSDKFMIGEGIIWLGFFLSSDFSNSYRDDYENYGTQHADVNWSGKSDLFAAHVGNYNSTIEYNDFIRMISGSSEDTYNEQDESNLWDWQNNSTLRRKYDRMRNKSEQLDEARTLMIAAFAINRMASVFNVLSISRKHGRSFSFDAYEESDEVGLKINYNF